MAWEELWEMQSFRTQSFLLDQNLHYDKVPVCACACYICDIAWIIAPLSKHTNDVIVPSRMPASLDLQMFY
jgi:hypothetical protein